MCRWSSRSHVGPWSTGILRDQCILQLCFIHLLVWSPCKQRMTPCYYSIRNNDDNDDSWFTYCWQSTSTLKACCLCQLTTVLWRQVYDSLPFPDEETKAQRSDIIGPRFRVQEGFKQRQSYSPNPCPSPWQRTASSVKKKVKFRLRTDVNQVV